MAEFWATWWRTAGDAQKSMIDRMQSQIGEARDWMREAANQNHEERKSA